MRVAHSAGIRYAPELITSPALVISPLTLMKVLSPTLIWAPLKLIFVPASQLPAESFTPSPSQSIAPPPRTMSGVLSPSIGVIGRPEGSSGIGPDG